MEQIFKTTLVFLITFCLTLLTVSAFEITDDGTKTFMSFIPWLVALMYATLAYLNQGPTFLEIDREMRNRNRK